MTVSLWNPNFIASLSFNETTAAMHWCLVQSEHHINESANVSVVFLCVAESLNSGKSSVTESCASLWCRKTIQCTSPRLESQSPLSEAQSSSMLRFGQGFLKMSFASLVSRRGKMPTVRSTTDSSPLLLNISYQGSCHQKLFMPGATDPRWRLVISTALWRRATGSLCCLAHCVCACVFFQVPVCRSQEVAKKQTSVYSPGRDWRSRKDVFQSHDSGQEQQSSDWTDWSGLVALSDPAAWCWQHTRRRDTIETCSVFQNQHFLVKVKKTEWMFF